MTTKRKSTSSAPTTTTGAATASALAKRVKTSSTSTSYNEEGGERVLTEKEKRKAARMVRNRLSAQNSRDKKRHHLESLESTIHHLQAENKDLMQRLIRALGDSTLGSGNGNGNDGGAGMGMGMGRLPLSPGPSSLKEMEEEEGSEGVEGDSEEEEEEEEGSFTPSPSSQNESRRPSTQPLVQPITQSSQAPPQPHLQPQQPTYPTPQSNLFNQSLVTLTTENLALKDRIKKLENVIQVLVAGTAIGSGGFGLSVVPSAVNSTSGAASVSVSPQAVMKVEDVQPQYPLTAINPMSLVSPPSHAHQSSHYRPQASTSTSTSSSAFLPTPTFTPNNQDRACQPAALAIASPSLVEEESTLQRARFFPSRIHKKGRVNKDKDKDKEEREQRWKMEVGLERVLRWRRGVEVEVGAGA